MNLIREIWQSIVRRDPLSTDKGKTELVFLNVWLHIHPAKVKKENLKFRHTFYLGFITFFLFLHLGWMDMQPHVEKDQLGLPLVGGERVSPHNRLPDFANQIHRYTINR